jgi:hypothetical protein
MELDKAIHSLNQHWQAPVSECSGCKINPKTTRVLRIMVACISTTTPNIWRNLLYFPSLDTLLMMSATNPAPLYSWQARSASTRLVYIRDNRKADLEVVNLRGPLGFDLEWRPNVIKGQVENPVALVQLSDMNTILLIQVSAMAGMILFHTLCSASIADRISRISQETQTAPWKSSHREGGCWGSMLVEYPCSLC